MRFDQRWELDVTSAGRFSKTWNIIVKAIRATIGRK